MGLDVQRKRILACPLASRAVVSVTLVAFLASSPARRALILGLPLQILAPVFFSEPCGAKGGEIVIRQRPKMLNKAWMIDGHKLSS
jgi:hypothetical protein